MFLVEALYPFSAAILNQQHSVQKNNQQNRDSNLQSQHHLSNQNNCQAEESQKTIEKQVQSSEQQSAKDFQGKEEKLNNEKSGGQENNITPEITYLTFEKGDKILVLESYENGWWYGNTLKKPEIKGFFPSNYIQVSAKPKPPPPPVQQPEPQSDSDFEQAQKPEEQRGIDWVKNELKNITQGPVKSDYYLGIKGYKNVKIDDKNQNVLKGDHVRFDVSTGLAKVPVKDQAPVAKAVRQMGYYFDYHQWNEERNKNPAHKARPDPKKKKIKKLNLKGMK